MTRTQAHVCFLLMKKVVEYIRKNGGNKDTMTFMYLCNAFESLKSVYGFNDNGKIVNVPNVRL